MKKYDQEVQIKKLSSCLKNYATEADPLSITNIAIDLGIREHDRSRPQTRKLIREAIKRGLPVGSNHKGYFLLKSERQMQRYLNSLLARQIALSERIADVYYGFYHKTK